MWTILISSKFEISRCFGMIHGNAATFKETTSAIAQSRQP
jgi:hypothetical protein